jgi:hypothetical protein
MRDLMLRRRAVGSVNAEVFTRWRFLDLMRGDGTKVLLAGCTSGAARALAAVTTVPWGGSDDG